MLSKKNKDNFWFLAHTWRCLWLADWAEFSEQSVFGTFRSSSSLLAACVHASQPQHCSYFTQGEQVEKQEFEEAGLLLNAGLLLFPPDVVCLSEECWFLLWNSGIVFTDLIRCVHIWEQTISVDQFLDSHKHSTLALQLTAHCYKPAYKGSCLCAV